MKEPIRPEDIKKGDLIRHERTAEKRNRAYEYVADFDGDGWSDADDASFLLDRPKPPLPIEPGVYLDRAGDVWQIHEGSTALTLPYPDPFALDPANFAPFTRLEPVPETAKRVLERVSVILRGTSLPNEFSKLGAEFGVTL